jgi:hypothetical protein
MKLGWLASVLSCALILGTPVSVPAGEPPGSSLRPIIAARSEAAAAEQESTIQGSLMCNGACLPDPKPSDHVMVLYAIDGTPEIRFALAKLMAELYPQRGLDADSATKFMNEFAARLKYDVLPDSPALANVDPKSTNHYCQPAKACEVSGQVIFQGGKKSIRARLITPTRLIYPAQMLAADQPFSMPDREPLTIRINDEIRVTCIAIPPGKFLMGTPHFMWPYYVEEYPHEVSLTRRFYLAEIPITQEMFEAVMGHNPSAVRKPRLPVQDPSFADIDRFCEIVSRRNGKHVRLPTDAEWEYAARVGTSNPGFPEKYAAQNSSGPQGFKFPLEVRSKAPNAWGLYDMASCWWEITGDRGMYNVRHAEIDPRYPPMGTDLAKVQRSGRGIIKDNWSVGTHEFILEKGYAGQKFRIAVDEEGSLKK